MPLNIVIGAQWGDEGKGRVVDLMAENADVVARFSGGDNAGHTVKVKDETFKLHLMPSGIVHQSVTCVIGNGVVVNPGVLLAEMDELENRGIDVSPGRLKLSDRANLITPAHIALDRAHEMARGDQAIGTTLRGIGPAYTDKAQRTGLRAELLRDPETLADEIERHVIRHNQYLGTVGASDQLSAKEIALQYAEYASRLAPYLADTSYYLASELDSGREVLAEGAQGTLLDLDHGTYPFVTSSNSVAASALVGLGLGPKVVGKVVGVAKAFTTRVGGGPFVTELQDELAGKLRGTGENPWDEFGTTTGRPRRVGWLDLVLLRYAARVNGLTHLVLTKLDILSGFPELRVCVGYEWKGQRLPSLPANLALLGQCKPVYVNLDGWSEGVTGARTVADLPSAARRYIEFVSSEVGLPIPLASVGPARDQVVTLEEAW